MTIGELRTGKSFFGVYLMLHPEYLRIMLMDEIRHSEYHEKRILECVWD